MPAITKYAVIVAGGRGKRLGSKIPKQFLELKGRPIIMRSVEAFYQYSDELQLILVLPEGQKDTWKDMCKRYGFNIPVRLVTGGSTRFQSVRNGLKTIKGEGLVAIHDGVRPLVNTKTIRNSFETADMHDSAIAVIALKNSIRKIDASGSGWLNRDLYRIVQTPQTFRVGMIRQAYDIPESPKFTDDASVWEAAGHQVTFFEGSEKNLKITTLQDLLIAEVLMN